MNDSVDIVRLQTAHNGGAHYTTIRSRILIHLFPD